MIFLLRIFKQLIEIKDVIFLFRYKNDIHVEFIKK